MHALYAVTTTFLLLAGAATARTISHGVVHMMAGHLTCNELGSSRVHKVSASKTFSGVLGQADDNAPDTKVLEVEMRPGAAVRGPVEMTTVLRSSIWDFLGMGSGRAPIGACDLSDLDASAGTYATLCRSAKPIEMWQYEPATKRVVPHVRRSDGKPDSAITVFYDEKHDEFRMTANVSAYQSDHNAVRECHFILSEN